MLCLSGFELYSRWVPLTSVKKCVRAALNFIVRIPSRSIHQMLVKKESPALCYVHFLHKTRK